MQFMTHGIWRWPIGVGSITEVKQCRARFIIGWVTPGTARCLMRVVGLRAPETSENTQCGVLGMHRRL